jgi:hypothetical protein
MHAMLKRNAKNSQRKYSRLYSRLVKSGLQLAELQSLISKEKQVARPSPAQWMSAAFLVLPPTLCLVPRGQPSQSTCNRKIKVQHAPS